MPAPLTGPGWSGHNRIAATTPFSAVTLVSRGESGSLYEEPWRGFFAIVLVIERVIGSRFRAGVVEGERPASCEMKSLL
jgi:hypothetical protein